MAMHFRTDTKIQCNKRGVLLRFSFVEENFYFQHSTDLYGVTLQ